MGRAQAVVIKRVDCSNNMHLLGLSSQKSQDNSVKDLATCQQCVAHLSVADLIDDLCVGFFTWARSKYQAQGHQSSMFESKYTIFYRWIRSVVYQLGSG